MRFALVDNNRIEAKSGLKGVCPFCLNSVIAKCGAIKLHHWAHKGTIKCDRWWETETEWHRDWKDNFPVEWQEVVAVDERTKEKHIADVKTIDNLVMEFQHSHITPEERISREKFYKNMVWVVDGTRLKWDYPRFLKEWKGDGISDVYECNKPNIFKVTFPEFCFPKGWLDSNVPVIFDFLGDGTLEDIDGRRKLLYCLFPQVSRRARVAEISRSAFIKSVSNGEWADRVKQFIIDFKEQDTIQLQIEEQERYQSVRRGVNPFGRRFYIARNPKRSRRF